MMTKKPSTGNGENIAEIEAIVSLMRKNQVTKLKTRDYEIEIDADTFVQTLSEEQNKIIKTNVDATDEDILMNPYHGMD